MSINTYIQPSLETCDQQNKFTHISLFLGLFDNHTQYAPITSIVVKKTYMPGGKLPAFLSMASNNEQMKTTFNNPYIGNINVTQIAGTVCRRIRSLVNIGDKIDSGKPYGKILFGSRVDVNLPLKYFYMLDEIRVGNRVYAGQTILGYYIIDIPSNN